MKITILGSTSGTEPVTPRHQTSWILETEKSIYFFDTGESCSYTAYRMGIDVLKTKRIFFSHPHLDHTAGLPHLLFLFRKIQTMEERKMEPPTIHTPHVEQAKAYLSAAFFAGMEEFYTSFGVEPIRKDGVIFENEEIKVEAKHNFHLAPEIVEGRNVWRSYSFRIECEGKVILFSGDVKGPEDLGSWPEKADIFLMETGHHDPVEVCKYLEKTFTNKFHLVFMHHGRRILHNKSFYEEECPRLYSGKITIAEDGSQFLF